ncbi:MAG: hypothetical protein IKV53_03875 [Clostridia bacterium]|nr:hypothetical protein [Clostridia bacterium]
MTEAITVAILSLIGTAVGSFGGILSTQRLVKYRLEQLEKKVDVCNTLSERLAELEIKNKVCEHRIEKLEFTP